VALEWFGKQQHIWVPHHAIDVKRRLEANIFPLLGKRPLDQIEAPELLQAIRKIEDRGSYDLAHRVLEECGQVFRYGIATGRCTRNLTADLRGALRWDLLAPPVQLNRYSTVIDTEKFAQRILEQLGARLQGGRFGGRATGTSRNWLKARSALALPSSCRRIPDGCNRKREHSVRPICQKFRHVCWTECDAAQPKCNILPPETVTTDGKVGHAVIYQEQTSSPPRTGDNHRRLGARHLAWRPYDAAARSAPLRRSKARRAILARGMSSFSQRHGHPHKKMTVRQAAAERNGDGKRSVC
jgi:hypothetical protein